MTTIFFSYSHADEVLRDELEKHLAALKHQGMVDTWHDRCIRAGDEFNNEISDKLESAELILFLVSADFIASSYCYDVEMTRALERHRTADARVIPVILRACDWQDTPFGKLLATPRDGKPVRSWPDIDDAFLDVVGSLKAAIKETFGNAARLEQRADKFRRETASTNSSPTPVVSHLRSSNMRLRKQFSDVDKDSFLDSAFECMVDYFENSLHELATRSPHIATRFRRIDQNKFTATVYQSDVSVSSCTIILGGMLGSGISYSSTDQPHDNSYNDFLSVESDDYDIFFTAMFMSKYLSQTDSRLTPEGAAEYCWSKLMEPLQ